jgi:hypothetical protein
MEVDEMMLQSSTLGSFSDPAVVLRSLTSDSRRPDLLIVCEKNVVESLVSHLRQWCALPVRCCAFPGPLCLPRDNAGTFLLYGVNDLTLAQQIALHDWMHQGSNRPQMVSIATAALEPLVNGGHFLDALFQKLNLVRLDVRP